MMEVEVTIYFQMTWKKMFFGIALNFSITLILPKSKNLLEKEFLIKYEYWR